MNFPLKPLFSSVDLIAPLQEVVKELGYEHMTPIQAACIPIVMSGKDLMGQSKTGSGKTAAFGLPLLNKIKNQVPDLQRNGQTHALILCPTRELCTQVALEMRKFGRKLMGLKVLILSGGTPVGPQFAALETGVHVIVGTPGRVLDHLKRGSLDLQNIHTLILDEADRMLDMGFEEEMDQILSKVPEERQTLLFSATFPASIKRMSSRYQKDAEIVQISDVVASGGVTAKDGDNEEGISGEKAQNQPLIGNQIVQQYSITSEGDHPDDVFTEKFAHLLYILGKYKPETCVVFVNFKVNAVDLYKELTLVGTSVATLHGDLEQPERDSVMAKFRNKSVRVLIATDVAARGLDVENLDLVVNFDLPQKPDIYVHRIGRTGRAGKTGTAVSIIIPKEQIKIDQIQRHTSTTVQKVTISDAVLTNFPELKKGARLESAMTTLFISAGRKNKMRAGDILGALTGEAGNLVSADVGKIEIHDFFSYVAVATKVAKLALARLQSGRIKGKRHRVELAR